MNSSSTHASLKQIDILVVDDHAINREFLRTGLGRLAKSVDLASSGPEAIKLCAEKHFDVILLDLHMPQMDGLTTANRIRDLDTSSADARIMILTADTRPEEQSRLINAGMDQVMTKPIAIADLAAAIGGQGRPNPRLKLPGQRQIATTQLLDQKRALAAANNDQNLARKLQGMLEKELQTGLPRLDRMFQERRFHEASALLHQWAGAGGYAGATRFGQACRSLRQCLNRDMDSSPGTGYLDFLRVAHATQQALRLQDRK
jgi:CheY-like chemotaxis protein